ncbi:hypothetical protein [Paractinoplanes maris]|uniref:hypothetical protein n=1 Tax=Paractinoplanes maris TaxID=1734446 RepID=UPI0020211491|nr:hypothetical protein [Actinoplanes maris]
MTASAYSIYTGRATNWPMVVLTTAFAVPLLALSQAGLVIPVLLALVVVSANLLTATSIRTAAGPNGVTVRWGVAGWPRCTYRLEQIERVEVVDLPLWRVSYGFWWTPGSTNCTVRPGPALRLTLRTGRTVTITVPDAAAAVTALTDARSA